jgi:hypothetical protein
MNYNIWLFALLAVLILPFASAQSETEADTVTQAWAEAINSGDLEGWLALHAEDVEFANHSWFVGGSREEMRRWGQAVINAGGVYTIMEHSVNEDGTVRWLIDYKDRSFAIQEQGVIAIEDGLIQRLILSDLE